MQVANVLSSDVLARVEAEGCARARVGVSAREREAARLGCERAGTGRRTTEMDGLQRAVGAVRFAVRLQASLYFSPC